MQPTAYKRYALMLLMSILAFNFVDRVALGILLQDIKIELDLSDTELGLLSGIAFTLFYSVMGIPLARWADRGNRVVIIGLTCALWSVAVALCGTTGSFLQLLSIRVGVAVGEAGCMPPATSLIADYFTRAERPRAVGIYQLGAPLSTVFGFFLAGWLNQHYGWRATFIILGLPGLALAALALATLKEPRRRAAPAPTVEPPLKEVWATLWNNRTFRHLLNCLAVSFFFGYGIFQWQPAFFMRTYGLKSGEVGIGLALSYGLCGLLGTYGGGVLASRYACRNERLQFQAMSVLFAVGGLFYACVYLAPNPYWAFAFCGLGTMAIMATNGPVFAAIPTLVPPRMRAVAVALVLLVANLIGMGLGPLTAGILSDILHPWFAEQSLQYALIALCPGFLWCTWHLWRASQTVRRDLKITAQYEGDGVPGVPIKMAATE